MTASQESGHPVTDGQLWEAVVAAEQRMAHAQSAFYREAGARIETLRSALSGTKWETGAALSFLRVLGADVPDLLGELVGLCLSDSWARDARQAIGAGNREKVIPELDRIIRRRLSSADGHDFLRLAEMLTHLHAWHILEVLVVRALLSADGETREVGHHFKSAYGPMFGARGTRSN